MEPHVVFCGKLFRTNGKDATEIMEMLFWLNDAPPSLVHIHQLQLFPEKKPMNPIIPDSVIIMTMTPGLHTLRQPSGLTMACRINS